jgi:hypothetical protein
LWLPAIVLGMFGHARFAARATLGASVAPLTLLLLVAEVASNTVWQLDIPDYNGYVAGGLWLLLCGVPALCAELLRLRRPLAAATMALSVVLSAIMAAPSAFARTRQHDHVARTLAQQVLDEAPADAIVIAELDHYAGSLFYLQEAERQRPDVIVLVYGLASSRWHWQRIYQLHRRLAPFALQGPDGKPGRVRRFLRAHPDRTVLVERLELAAQLGLIACPGGVYLRTGRACATEGGADTHLPSRLSHALRELGDGSPGAAAAIALSSYTVGDDLRRMGYPRAALDWLLAGVPPRLLADNPMPKLPVHTLQQPRAWPRWKRGAALGDPARNLFVAGLLLLANDEPGAALGYVRAASNDGLPEARALLEQTH